MNFQKNTPVRLKGIKLRRLKEAVLDRDKFCVWCGRPDGLTFAHIVRVSQGGEDTEENTMCGCTSCHAAFDQYSLELPEKVWARMSIEHREEYVMTRRNLKWRSE